VPFYSSYGSDCNYGFHVMLEEPIAPAEYNYWTMAVLVAAGQGWATEGEQAGISVFLCDGAASFAPARTLEAATCCSARSTTLTSPAWLALPRRPSRAP